MPSAAIPQSYHHLGYQVLEDFSSTTVGAIPTGWSKTDSGTVAGSTVLVTTDYPVCLDTAGRKAVRFTVVGGDDAAGFGYPSIEKAVSWDLSRIDTLYFAVYIDGLPSGVPGQAALGVNNTLLNMLTLTPVQFSFSSDGAFTNFAQVSLNAASTRRTLYEGWNYIGVKKTEFTLVGGGVNWGAVNRVRIRVQGNTASTKPYVVGIGGIVLNGRQRPKLILGFDNSLLSPWTQYQIWKAANPNSAHIPIMYYLHETAVNSDASHLSDSDLTAIAATGSEIAIHSGTPNGSVAYDQLSKQAVIDNIKSIQEFLNDRGFIEGQKHLAWPLGAYGRNASATLTKAEIIDAVRSCGVKTARTINPNASNTYATTAAAQTNQCILTTGPTAPYELFCFGIDSDRDGGLATKYNAYIDYLVAYGGMLELYTHWVSDTTQSLSRISLAEFQALLTYIDNYRKRGLLDVVTKSTWYNHVMFGRAVA